MEVVAVQPLGPRIVVIDHGIFYCDKVTDYTGDLFQLLIAPGFWRKDEGVRRVLQQSAKPALQ